jgi:hypothetical protein
MVLKLYCVKPCPTTKLLPPREPWSLIHINSFPETYSSRRKVANFIILANNPTHCLVHCVLEIQGWSSLALGTSWYIIFCWCQFSGFYIRSWHIYIVFVFVCRWERSRNNHVSLLSLTLLSRSWPPPFPNNLTLCSPGSPRHGSIYKQQHSQTTPPGWGVSIVTHKHTRWVTLVGWSSCRGTQARVKPSEFTQLMIVRYCSSQIRAAKDIRCLNILDSSSLLFPIS